MRKRALLLAVPALLISLAPAVADTLRYHDGKVSSGALRSVKFQSGGIDRIIGRKALKSVRLGIDGSDAVALTDGTERKGKVVLVQFQSAVGFLSVPRKRLIAVKLSSDGGASALAAAERTEGPTPEKAELTSAQKKALALSLALRNVFWDKPAGMRKQEIAETKRNYLPEIKKVLDEIKTTKKTIRTKEQRRDDAMREWARDKARARKAREEGRPARHVPPRPTFNDGLEDDEKALKDAGNRKRLLAREIQLKLKRVSSRLAARRKSISAAYARLRAAIEAGTVVAKEEMVAKYQAALGSVQSEGPEQKPAEPTKKDGAPKNGEPRKDKPKHGKR